MEVRLALDRDGGSQIAIDYPVIIPNTTLNDAVARGSIISTLADLPIENVRVRASGFGADAGPLAINHYLSSMSGFHNLGKPIIADYLGGVVGVAALAFGAVSGLAQGIEEKERFDGRTWHKTPKPSSEGSTFGRTVRVGIPDLHRSVTLKEFAVLVSAKGGRRLCGCGDRSCCPHGFADMKADHTGHAARQLFKSLLNLEVCSRPPP